MRILTNICSADLALSKAFYVELLGLQVKYDSDWYVQLCVPGNADMEYGIIQRSHELVPSQYQQRPTGMYVTFVVPDVEVAYQQALRMRIPILQEPRDEFYGQRRFLTQDPDGCLIDICSPLGDEA
ncbi:MAG: VOC family protein [Pseudomonadota bacterium]